MAKSIKATIQLRIVLVDIKPEVWRRVAISADTTLHELHRIIQLLFEWYDYHLYEFNVAGVRYEYPDAEAVGRDSTRIRISRLGLSVGDEFTYTYDFGDDWLHRIKIESPHESIDSDGLPFVVAGERRGPPEDCGGVPGFERLLEALKDPQDPEHDEYKTWAGEAYLPDTFDVRTIRHALLLSSVWARPMGKKH
jgi:hypothetical protein